MTPDLRDTLVVAISTTALFDLAEAERIFVEEGMAAYRAHTRATEDEPLQPGTGMPLVRALLSLNAHVRPGDPPLAEVIVLSRNAVETGVRALNAVRGLGLPITRYGFTGGEALDPYLRAFGVDLFLSRNEADVQAVIDAGGCAAALLYAPPAGEAPPTDQLRIAFDADAVLFHEASEVVFKTEGLDAFYAAEDAARDLPMAEGPHAAFLKKLARLQERLPDRIEYNPVRLAIVTARSAPAELRVIRTLRQWGVYVDATFFLGGLAKDAILAAFRPHIYFDDQDHHLASASRSVPSGRVPYRSDSPLSAGGSVPRAAISRSPADK